MTARVKASSLCGVVSGSSLRVARRGGQNSSREGLAVLDLDYLRGRFAVLTAEKSPAVLTAAACLLRQAQESGSPVVWVAVTDSIFFPPDFSSNGIDLSALPVVFGRNLAGGAQAADCLLRCGGFALVFMDMGDGRQELRLAQQARLAGLARQNGAALVMLHCHSFGHRRGGEGGSFASLRAAVCRVRVPPSGQYHFQTELTKNKCGHPLIQDGPGSAALRESAKEVCYGPAGLC